MGAYGTVRTVKFTLTGRWARLKAWGRKLLVIQDSPEKIAAGFAIGVFFGIFPTLGLGGLLSIGVAWMFGVNTAAALVGTLAGIPLLSPLVITVSGWIGGTLLGEDWGYIASMLKQHGFRTAEFRQALKEGFHMYLLGNTVLSLLCAMAGYLFTHALVVDYQRRKVKKQFKNPPQ